ncbi:estradiol 17-beta-dehydrogenase 2-like [Notothenia coriiceps]|uniref:Estradiol 17-beta-dehydrogenase 2-like n=1 Tax=Notothenia coriiceps TaxID=8208 RepID=A0A6I9PTE0_9TELE|nr:PREDICTED: estradiol 17-beta-dehydrogenase 2-like [Notothenia coriiceps]
MHTWTGLLPQKALIKPHCGTMAPLPVLRAVLLVSFSVLLTVLLGFGLPALLNTGTRVLGLPESSVTECIVGLYLLFVLFMATPRIPRGLVEVKGRAVFVTGCDSGFGHALSKHLHKLGFTVYAGCLLKDEGGEGAKELEEFHSDRMKVVQLDVCSEEQVNQAVEYIRENLEDADRGTGNHSISPPHTVFHQYITGLRYIQSLSLIV